MKEIEQLTQGAQRVDQLVRRLGEHTDHLEPIEIDLLLQELRSMYSAVLRLTPTTAAAPTAEPVTTIQAEAKAAPRPEAAAAAQPVAPVIPRHVMAPEDEVEDPEVPAQSLMDPEEQSDNEVLFEVESAVEPEPLAAIEFEPVSELESELVVEQPVATPEPVAESLFDAEPEQPATKEPEAKTEPTPQPQVEPSVAASRQSSLFDYIRTSNQNSEAVAAETLGDRLGRTGSGMRGETAQHKHVSDLRTVININDKFSFMKDLFQNNMKAYNDFIIQLNSIDDRATAQRRVDEVAQIYNWDKNSLTVKTFYSIFDRKF